MQQQQGLSPFTASSSMGLWTDLLTSDREKRMMCTIDTIRKECRHTECKKTATLLCSKCRAVAYCSVECQKTDWTALHKSMCFPITIFSLVMREDVEGCKEMLEAHRARQHKRVMDVMNYINEHKELGEEITKAFEGFPVVRGELLRLASIASSGLRKLQPDDTQTLLSILMQASSPCHSAIAMSLDKEGRPKEAKPLIHFAVATGSQAIVDVLLAHGARLDEKDTQGQTAADALRDFEHSRAIEMSTTLRSRRPVSTAASTTAAAAAATAVAETQSTAPIERKT